MVILIILHPVLAAARCSCCRCYACCLERCWRMRRMNLAQHHGHSRCADLSPPSVQDPAVCCSRRRPEQQPQQRQASAGPRCTGATTQPAAVCPRPDVWEPRLRSLQSHSPPTPHWWWLQLTAPPAGSPLQWGSPAARDPPQGAAQASLAQTHLLCTSSMRVRNDPSSKLPRKH